nr:host specificity factor TipJ family phage tail protein [uncultured Moraxella sp.]
MQLIVVKSPFDYANDNTQCQILNGNNLFDLVQSVYPKGLPLNTFLYHDKWDMACDVTPKDDKDIDNLNAIAKNDSVFYLVTYPSAAIPMLAIVAIIVGVSLAVAFLMPMPEIPNTGTASQPPSPNNALAQRTNRQRLGGRVPDIFGEVWAVPDLLAPSYSVFIDNQEVEFSYFCLGVGQYDVKKCYDDTTPINQIRGATALVFNPNKGINDTPDFRFGSNFTADEAEFAGLAVKRYSAVNGQVLNPPDDYLSSNVVFQSPNVLISVADGINFATMFNVGDSLLIEKATDLKSGNDLKISDNQDVSYNLNGTYRISEVSEKQIVLDDVVAIAPDWQNLIDNQDLTVKQNITVSTQDNTLWQGWFYTDLPNHTDVMLNLKAPNGIYTSYGDEWSALRVWFDVESELVDSVGNPINGTLAKRSFYIQSPSYEKYLDGQGRAWVRTTDDDVRRSAYRTVKLSNPNFGKGKRLRFRIRRTTKKVNSNKGQVLQEIKLADFYGISQIDTTPKGVTTVYTKTVATEGALSVKERKLKLLVERYVKNWQDNDNLILSKRIDDIIYHIATDSKVGGLASHQLNMTQIKAEIDQQIAYFGTAKTAEFCGTFDTTNITTEEMIQMVAQAGFCQAYRLDNQIHLHFERKQDFSIVQFNAHNILPDSYEYSESFGVRNDYDGVQVTYTDPTDDAKITMSYPQSAINPQKLDLIGVRNKVQAHIAMMRTHHKNQLAYKTCTFTGADESGLVIPTNRIDVADLLTADSRGGVVENMDVMNGETVLTVSEPIDLAVGTACTVFVQTVAGLVDNIKCTVKSAFELTLSRPPSQPLSLDYDAVVRAVYKLSTRTPTDIDSYIVTSKETGGNALSHKLTCINYTDKYYQNDTDFKNKLIAP